MLGELTGSRTALSTGQGPKRGPAATQLLVPVIQTYVLKHATQTHKAVLMGPAWSPLPTSHCERRAPGSSAWAVLFSLPQGWWQCYCVCFHIPEQAGATLTSTPTPTEPRDWRVTGWAAAAGAQ